MGILNGSAPQFLDSTAYANNMTASGTGSGMSLWRGKLGMRFMITPANIVVTILSRARRAVWGQETKRSAAGFMFRRIFPQIAVMAGVWIFLAGRMFYPSTVFRLGLTSSSKLVAQFGGNAERSISDFALATGTWYYLTMSLSGTTATVTINGNIDTQTSLGADSLVDGKFNIGDSQIYPNWYDANAEYDWRSGH